MSDSICMRKSTLLTIIFTCLITCQQPKKNQLTIAIAANVQFAMDSLVSTFRCETGVSCQVIIGSSGKLTAQIHQGAPYDIFISADMKYPKTLYRNGLTNGKPKIYAYGQLALWASIDTPSLSVNLLSNDQIKHIAIANPEVSPYGLASVEIFKHYGLYDVLKDKLIYGESIAQVNELINLRVVDAGFTAKSAFVSGKMTQRGQWLVVAIDSYTPVAQGVVRIKRNHITDIYYIEKFYQFLFSKQTQHIFQVYGYSTETTGSP